MSEPSDLERGLGAVGGGIAGASVATGVVIATGLAHSVPVVGPLLSGVIVGAAAGYGVNKGMENPSSGIFRGLKALAKGYIGG